MKTSPRRKLLRILLTAPVAGFALSLAACGGSSHPSTTASAPSSTNLSSSNAAAAGSAARSGAVIAHRASRVLASVHVNRGSRPEPHLRGFDQSSVTSFIHKIDSDVSDFWQAVLSHNRIHFTPVFEEIIEKSGPVDQGCDSHSWTSDTQNAMFCGADDTIYLPLNFLTRIYRKFGDAAVAAVVAHENGHHVQQLLGILGAYQGGRLHPIQIELQADCFAGVWMASGFERGRVQPSDITNALGLLHDVGDPTGTLPTTPGAHSGTGQRTSAFLQGYNSGQGAQCDIPQPPR